GLEREEDALARAFPFRLGGGEGFSRRDVPNIVDRLRLKYQGMGDLLDELLDENPVSRLFEAGIQPMDYRVFGHIKSRIEVELSIYAGIYGDIKHRGLRWLVSAVDLVLPSSEATVSQLREAAYRFRGSVT